MYAKASVLAAPAIIDLKICLIASSFLVFLVVHMQFRPARFTCEITNRASPNWRFEA